MPGKDAILDPIAKGSLHPALKFGLEKVQIKSLIQTPKSFHIIFSSGKEHCHCNRDGKWEIALLQHPSNSMTYLRNQKSKGTYIYFQQITGK